MKYFTIIIILMIFNLQGICIDSLFYRRISHAEDEIIKGNYLEAIKSYNYSFSVHKLTYFSLQNYVKIMKIDSNLKNKYLDTFINFANKYNIDLTKRLKALNINYVPPKSTTQDPCANLNLEFDEMAKIDQAIRKNAMEHVSQVDMYKIEPYKSQIAEVDSINYLKLYAILLNKNNNSCIYNITDKHALIFHMLSNSLNNSSLKLDEIMISLAKNGYLDQLMLANALETQYNTSIYHKRKSEYDFNIDCMATNNYFIFPNMTKEKLETINNRRKLFNIEPIERYVSKQLWQLNNNKLGFLFNNIPIITLDNDKEELNFVQKIIKNKPFIIQKINAQTFNNH